MHNGRPSLELCRTITWWKTWGCLKLPNRSRDLNKKVRLGRKWNINKGLISKWLFNSFIRINPKFPLLINWRLNLLMFLNKKSIRFVKSYIGYSLYYFFEHQLFVTHWLLIGRKYLWSKNLKLIKIINSLRYILMLGQGSNEHHPHQIGFVS